MTTIDKLNAWAKEINNNWDKSHRADVRDNELRVYRNHELCVTVATNLDIEEHAENVSEIIEQLNYMIER